MVTSRLGVAVSEPWRCLKRGLLACIDEEAAVCESRNAQKTRSRSVTPIFSLLYRCAPSVKATWPILFARAKSAAGRAQLSSVFRLCAPLSTEDDGERLAGVLLNFWDTLAMGALPHAVGPIHTTIHTRVFHIFHLCAPLSSEEDGGRLAGVLLNFWDTMAMGARPNIPWGGHSHPDLHRAHS